MKLRKSSSLFTAEIVINILMNDESLPHQDIVDKYDPYIESYQNGREQGFSISGLDGFDSISFAEHRNSDNIVVYFGKKTNQGLSDEAYANAKFFKYMEYHAAAEYISMLIAKHGFKKE
jgi:hypothetical protein